MSIHDEHPFATPRELRDPVRRLRGHLPAPVTVWASAAAGRRDGWTISSVLVGEGQPAELVALIDEDCDWWDLFRSTGTAMVNVLAQGQGRVADAFARVAPSAGGPFRTGVWTGTDVRSGADVRTGPGSGSSYGPRLEGAAAWLGVRLVDAAPPHAGWGLVVRATIESLELADDIEALGHRYGRYS